MQPDLVALILDGDVEQIQTSAYYKINIKRYVERVADNTLFFHSGLSYLSMKKIVDVFQKQSSVQGYDITIAPQVLEYVSKREMYLDTRAKLGIEIKKQDSKFSIEFSTFEKIVGEKMERTLREKQMWDSFFMTSMKKSCNFSVPGSGKTSSVYGMYAFLKAQKVIKRIVVICPKNAFAPWVDEFEECFGNKDTLRLYSIQDTEGSSKLQRKASIKFDTGTSNVLLFNYECTKSYVNEIKSLIDSETLLVFDEVHKVKRIDGEYATAAIEIAKNANYIVAMTGTPIPNTYQDIYNLLHILFGEEYDDFFAFQANGLKRPSTTTIEKVNRKLQPFFCRTTKQQLGVPKPNTDSIIPVPANENEQRIFKVLSQKYKKNKLLLMLRILQLESQAQQLLSSWDLSDFQYLLTDDVPIKDIDYADYSQELKECIESSTISSKTEQCINLVKGLIVQNKPVVVWCVFVKSIQNIASLLIKEGIKVKCVYGEIDVTDRQQILRDFKNHDFDVLITNPNTLAEAVSLHSICHDAVYFEYSFNLVHLLQSKDRIHRLGIPANRYTQFYFLQTMYPSKDDHYSMGEQIYNRLADKEKVMLNAIDSDLLEIMPTTQEELDMIFKPLLGKLK
jgi:SNF2 family DNA or RNA helicase